MEKGLKLEITISADDNNSLSDAIQALIDDIGQGNRVHKSATDEWFYSYKISGEEIND